MKQILLVALLITGFTSLPLSAETGGEDFPFFTCTVEGSLSVKRFRIIASDDSKSGYSLIYQNAVGIPGTIEIQVSESENEVIIEGYKKRMSGVYEKYFLAKINMEVPAESKSMFVRSTIGIPTTDGRLKTATCSL